MTNPTLTLIIRPWPQYPNHIAYAEAEVNGKKYVYNAHNCVWMENPDDEYSGIDDDDLNTALFELI